MNDVYRGVILTGAVLALYYSVRLTIAYLLAWRRGTEHRQHIAWHVFWMNASLMLAAGILITRLLEMAGGDHPVSYRDGFWGLQVVAMASGLRPVWRNYLKMAEARKERARKAEATPSVTSAPGTFIA